MKQNLMKRVLMGAAVLAGAVCFTVHAETFTAAGVTYSYTDPYENDDIEGVWLGGPFWWDSAVPTSTAGALVIPSSFLKGGAKRAVGGINRSAFWNCTNLTSVVIPDSVTHIGADAFKNCTSLTSVTMSSRVTRIGRFAFKGCTSLASMTIPKGVMCIEEAMFRCCSNLVDVTIPNGVVSIGQIAFRGCTSLTHVTIPNSVTNIGYGAFDECTSLTAIRFLGEPPEVANAAFPSCAIGYYSAENAEAWKAVLDYEGKWKGLTMEQEKVVEPTPTPTPEPEPEVEHYLAPEEDDAVDLSAAQVYNGYLYDEEDGVMAGTIQVKAAKQKYNKKTEQTTSKLSVTIQLAGKKISFKGEMDVDEGTFVGEAKDGRDLELFFGLNGMTGYYRGFVIDGTRNLASSKDKSEKSAANEIINDLKSQGAVMVAWEDETGWNGLSVTVGSKGKTKVALMLANGTKVSVSTTLIIGEEWCAVPVVYSKRGARRAFTVWMALDGSAAEVEGLGDDVLCGRFAAPLKDATLHLDEKEFAALLGEGGTYDLGTLKLTYKAKDGTFKGTFKAYRDVKGRAKKVTVSVSGVMIDGVGYGTATIKKVGSVPITIE